METEPITTNEEEIEDGEVTNKIKLSKNKKIEVML